MQPKIYTVLEVTKYIKHIIDNNDNLALIYVVGEISNYKQYPSGHCYFVLKDANAIIKAVMFKSKASMLRFIPHNGLQVVVSGHVSVFERDGTYQLYANSMIPEGIGELTIAFQQLKEKLAKEGLFEQKYKKRLPFLPKAIGIITSPTGAAVRDIITVARRRHPYIKMILYPVQVQGKLASGQIANAIKVFNDIDGVDVLIVGRGGGSLEDLWAFNEEVVVRAIYDSNIPVISAVGHETDVTLSDFVADQRAATPSQAAEISVPDYWQLQQHIDKLRKQLETSINKLLRNKVQTLKTLCSDKVFKKIISMHNNEKKNLILSKQTLQHNMINILSQKKIFLKNLVEKLAILNPLTTLTRGYSIVYDEQEMIVSDISNVKINSIINIHLHQGIIVAKACEVKKH